MARFRARTLLNLACGVSLPWLCSAALAGKPPEAKPAKPASYEEYDSGSADAINTESSLATEVIRERFANGTVKIERHVIQDAQGNYLNHGLWSQWDERGRLIGSGEFRNGRREGRWARGYTSSEAPMFKDPLYKDFQAPFAAEAEFKDGVLNGIWRTYDSKNRKMSEWTFEEGKRSGKSIWYQPNGQKRREVDYRNDDIDGEVLQWSADQKLASREKYNAGHKLAKQVEFYTPGQKKSEGWTLFAREITAPHYDWWAGAADIKVTGKDGIDRKQGLLTTWHKNGQKKMEGNYEANLPIGKFVWWYSNGQKQFEGEYVDGKETGRFIWWHENGQKQLEGEYLAGTQTGKWMRWNASGKVIEMGDYSDTGRKLEDNKPNLSELDGELSAPSLRSAAPVQTFRR